MTAHFCSHWAFIGYSIPPLHCFTHSLSKSGGSWCLTGVQQTTQRSSQLAPPSARHMFKQLLNCCPMKRRFDRALLPLAIVAIKTENNTTKNNEEEFIFLCGSKWFNY